MRLPVDGIYEDRPALASLIIEHKGERPCQGIHRDVRLIQHCVSGVPVKVGSGFTNSQRIEFAKDPSLIVSSLTMLELRHPIDGNIFLRLASRSRSNTLASLRAMLGTRRVVA